MLEQLALTVKLGVAHIAEKRLLILVLPLGLLLLFAFVLFGQLRGFVFRVECLLLVLGLLLGFGLVLLSLRLGLLLLLQLLKLLVNFVLLRSGLVVLNRPSHLLRSILHLLLLLGLLLTLLLGQHGHELV